MVTTSRSRFETQVLDQAVISSSIQQPLTPPPTPPCITSPEPVSNSNSCSSSPIVSPARTKLSIRRNFLQKRLENKDRFRTQTLSESSFSPSASLDSPPLSAEVDIHLHLQKEANLILKTLHATKTSNDELLDCETLSLVSNDDDSEHNSASSVSYRTYHKSWGISQNNIPVIASVPSVNNTEDLVNNLCPEALQFNASTEEDAEENEQTKSKPKIVKPNGKPPEEFQLEESPPKAIRGRRKPLYSKSNLTSKITPKSIRPVRNVTSNLVKNVSSNFKPTNVLTPITNRQMKTVTSTSSTVKSKTIRPVSQSSSPKTSPARVPTVKGSPKHTPTGVGKAMTTTSVKGIYCLQSRSFNLCESLF